MDWQLEGSNASEERDMLADLRHSQLSSGTDRIFANVLVPLVTRFAAEADRKRVVDVGCGTGHLTQILAEHCEEILGIDISERSVAIARERILGERSDHLRYLHAFVAQLFD
jgi:ubiquinone/menaquinone biosynthesis C-methylase UbiE